MSAAVMNTPMFECSELLFKNAAPSKKDPSTNSNGNGHAPLRRSYTSLVNLIEQHRKLDRSVSEPTSRYKTELCRPFEESGVCKYGDKCQFAHGFNELRNLARHPKYKTELCRTFHTIGFCPYGPRCHFVHNFEELCTIHNQKVNAAPAPATAAQSNIMGLNPLIAGNGPATNVSVSLLEQIATSPQVAAVAAAAAAAAAASTPLMRANSLSLGTPAAATSYNQPLLRTNSLTLANITHLHQHHQQHSTGSVIGAPRPKPLNLSPTFSLGSTADSISPSSSLSQSPTNSMASFFSDDQTGIIAPTPFSFGQDFGLLATRQSPSPQGICSPISDDLTPRTPSPLSSNGESRLPVFNRISSTRSTFENLKI
ncbi:protein TIS11 [Leptopilina boulardi]|uniref:protein TIS11 n=1 Tax=Leptopilina boulardi TaxID=63433 RepID=UPI0021F65623|nr:protein TIS11 [Leptopilina boulardi]XP_051176476.1 protein TIS11 [Leptopilina boulardi]